MTDENKSVAVDRLVTQQTARLIKKMARTLRKADQVTAADISAYGKLVESYGMLVSLVDDGDDQETVIVDRLIIQQTEMLLKTTGRNIKDAETISASEVSAYTRLIEVYAKLIALQERQEEKGKENFYDHMASGKFMTKVQLEKEGKESPIFG